MEDQKRESMFQAWNKAVNSTLDWMDQPLTTPLLLEELAAGMSLSGPDAPQEIAAVKRTMLRRIE